MQALSEAVIAPRLGNRARPDDHQHPRAEHQSDGESAQRVKPPATDYVWSTIQRRSYPRPAGGRGRDDAGAHRRSQHRHTRRPVGPFVPNCLVSISVSVTRSGRGTDAERSTRKRAVFGAHPRIAHLQVADRFAARAHGQEAADRSARRRVAGAYVPGEDSVVVADQPNQRPARTRGGSRTPRRRWVSTGIPTSRAG